MNIKIPQYPIGQIQPIAEIAPPKIENTATNKARNLTELVKVAVDSVNKSQQASANHKIIDQYTSRVLPKIEELKQKALTSGDYTKFRTEATVELNKFFNSASNPFERKTIEAIRDQKTSAINQMILNFETNEIVAQEAEKIATTFDSLARQVLDDPMKLESNLSSLEQLKGNFSVVTGSSAKGKDKLRQYKQALAATAVSGAIDVMELGQAFNFFENNKKNLDVTDIARLGRQLAKRAETEQRVADMLMLAEAIYTNQIPFQPQNSEHVKALEAYMEINQKSPLDMATTTNFVSKKAIAELEGSVIAGGLDALEAADTINKLTKMNSVVARQIEDQTKALATKFLRSYKANGDPVKAAEEAKITPKGSDFEVKRARDIIGEARKNGDKQFKPSNILGQGVNDDDIDAYHNVRVIDDYIVELEKNMVNYGLPFEAAQEQARQAVRNMWGVSKYGSDAWFWNDRVPTRLPLEQIQRDLAIDEEDKKKEWAFVQLQHQLQSKEIKKRDVYFEWTGKDKINPTYQVFVVKDRQLLPMLDNDWDYVYFKPDYAKYKEIEKTKPKIAEVGKKRVKRTVLDKENEVELTPSEIEEAAK